MVDAGGGAAGRLDGRLHGLAATSSRKRTEPIYFPGHGGAVTNAPRFVAAYILHRKAREAAIVSQLEKGESDIPALVGAIYANLDPRLTRAAGMSVLAHLEDLVARGAVATDGPPSIAGRYRLCRLSASSPAAGFAAWPLRRRLRCCCSLLVACVG